MSSTELALVEPGKFLALTQDPGEIEAIIQENLGGQELGEFDLPRVKVPAGGATTWEIPSLGGSEASKELTGVVVHFKLTRAYWPNGDPDGSPPVCRSNDSIVGIGSPGGDCRTCPLAQFGSAPDGNGQACSQKEIWFMLREGGFLPIVVALPAMSLKAAKQYRVGELGSAGLRLPTVVTKLTLVGDKNSAGQSYSRAVPQFAGALSPEEAAKSAAYAAALRPLFDSAAAAINAETAAGQADEA